MKGTDASIFFSAKIKFIPKGKNLIPWDESVKNLQKEICAEKSPSSDDVGESPHGDVRGTSLYVEWVISICQSEKVYDSTTFTDLTAMRGDSPPNKYQNKY